jgi:hypothetical protein
LNIRKQALRSWPSRKGSRYCSTLQGSRKSCRFTIFARASGCSRSHPRASRPERTAEDHTALKASIPDDFWHELRKQSLVAPTAPLPTDKESEGLGDGKGIISGQYPCFAERGVAINRWVQLSANTGSIKRLTACSQDRGNINKGREPCRCNCKMRSVCLQRVKPKPIKSVSPTILRSWMREATCWLSRVGTAS